MNARHAWVLGAVLGVAWGTQGCTQCETNERKVDGQCVRLCNSNFDCVGGEACQDGACHPVATGSSSSGGVALSSSQAALGSSTSVAASSLGSSSSVVSTSSSASLGSSSVVVSSGSGAPGTSGASSSPGSSSAPVSSSNVAPSSTSSPGSTSAVVSSSGMGSSSGAGMSSSSQMGGCLTNTSPQNAVPMPLDTPLDVRLCAPQPGPEYFWTVPGISSVGERVRLQVRFGRGTQATDWDFHLGVMDQGVPRSLIVAGSCARGAGRDEDCAIQLERDGVLVIRAYSGVVGFTEDVTLTLTIPPPPDGGVDACDTTLGNTSQANPVEVTEGVTNTFTWCATYYLDQYFRGGLHPLGTAMRVRAHYPNGGGDALFDVVPGVVGTNGGFLEAPITTGSCLSAGGDDICTFTLPDAGKVLLKVTTVPWADPQRVELLVEPI